MSFLLEEYYLLGLFVAAIITAAHCGVQSWLCRYAIRRLHAIQNEMGELCKRKTDPDANERMDSLAHEAAHLLARFDIDYWAAVERQPLRNKDSNSAPRIED
jgi:hypothetical protein